MRRVILLSAALMGVGGLMSIAPSSSAQFATAPIIKAIEVARIDFEKKLKQRPASDWELEKYVADINSYVIGVSEDEKNYYVVFLLRNKPGTHINGGGGRYLVAKGTLEIKEFLGYK